MATAAPAGKIDIGRVIQRGFQTIGRQAAPFVILAFLLVGLPTFASQIFLIEQIQGNDLTMILSPTYWAFMLLGMVAGYLLQAAIVRASIRDLRGERVEVASNLVEALKLLLPMIGMTILVGIATALGLVLLIVPGIIVYIMLIVAVPVLVEERRGIIGSMSRSRELTKGSRWQIFLLLVLFIVVYMIVGTVMTVVSVPLVSGSLVVIGIVQTVLATMLGLLSAAMLASLYVELRMVKEGVTAEGLAAIFE